MRAGGPRQKAALALEARRRAVWLALRGSCRFVPQRFSRIRGDGPKDRGARTGDAHASTGGEDTGLPSGRIEALSNLTSLSPPHLVFLVPVEGQHRRAKAPLPLHRPACSLPYRHPGCHAASHLRLLPAPHLRLRYIRRPPSAAPGHVPFLRAASERPSQLPCCPRSPATVRDDRLQDASRVLQQPPRLIDRSSDCARPPNTEGS